jgi:site-specific DNA recombinase
MFQQMIEYCRKNKGRVDRLVVYNLSRFARNTTDHHAVSAILAKYGVVLRSVTEPIDGTPSGRLMESVVAAVAQFDNDVRSERTKAGMSAAIERGRWPHKPPIGYRFEGSRSEARLVPDAVRAPLISKAFELAATAMHTVSEVLKIVTDEGLRNAKNKPLLPQTFNAILRRPAYKGWIVSKANETATRGEHQPLVDEATFDRVQQLLGQSKTGRTRNRANPHFPLKSTVRCGYCQQYLTASKSKGRNSSRYAYYKCWKRGCGQVKVRSEVLESDFLRYLADLQPKPAYVKLFREVVLDRWRENAENVERDLNRASGRIAELEERRTRLVNLLADGRITQDAYDDAASIVEDDLRVARVTRRDLQIDQIDVDAILDFGEQLLSNLASMWSVSTFEQQQRIQRAIVPSGLAYADGAFGNTETLSVFSYLREIGSTPERLASPTGFEPVSPP